MSKVKRLNFTVDQFESVVPYASEHGQYVRYADYAKLEAEAQALREEVERGNRITVAMALDISAVGEALGIPGEEQEGGTGEFIDLIRELQKEVEALRARVAVVPDRLPRSSDIAAIHQHSIGWNACLDELARLNGLTVSESALDTLRRFATGEVGHLNNGHCPDDLEGRETRDPNCSVCRALIDTEKSK
ncbi:hypothetical protein [Pseudomonas aeruginosa]|uniref:hypothetical protein n=1 Tax=Pseudomonas aeruginosa TaxID=287 RepID=UPI000EB09819|nr:hypothetical protein [Pseudomonas aeruginosa]